MVMVASICVGLAMFNFNVSLWSCKSQQYDQQQPGQEILTNPRSYWLKGTPEQKKVLFDFVFDKSLEIRNGKVGTAPYSLPYRLLSKPVIEKESMVELMVQNWNQLLSKFIFLHKHLQGNL